MSRYNNKVFCKECNIQTKYNSLHFGRYHLLKIHNMTTKEYYDKYLKKENEDVCVVCGKINTFHNCTDGYYRCCSNECNNKDIINKIKRAKSGQNTMMERYGVNNQILIPGAKEKRIITYTEIYGNEHPMKSQQCKDKRKETCLINNGVE